MTFQRETFSARLVNEIKPLLNAHYLEIAHYQDIPLDVNWRRYATLDAADALRIYTARSSVEEYDEQSSLDGYAIFVVSRNMHYWGSIQAVQDVLYLSPSSRGAGGRFIRWCDAQLQSDGVQVVYQHSKVAHDIGSLLLRLGYEHVENIYAKRLDRAKGEA